MKNNLYHPHSKNCKKCGRTLSQSELETRMEKCAPCLVKGYRFVLRQLHKELEELKK